MHPDRQLLEYRRDVERDAARIEFWIRDCARMVIDWLEAGRRGPFVFPVHTSVRHYFRDPEGTYSSPFMQVRVHPHPAMRGKAGLLIVERLLRTALEECAP